MKKIALLSLIWLSIACGHSGDITFSDCVPVKVITQLCGNVVLQIQDPSQQFRGEKWTLNGITYPGCFFTVLDCATEEGHRDLFYNNDASFKVRIVGEGIADDLGNCARCLALLAETPPKRVYQISVIDNCVSAPEE